MGLKMAEKIRDKNNKLLGTITTNSQGLKEVRNTYNVCLAVYDPKRNETRDKNNVVLTKYDSLVAILHKHINDKSSSQSKREYRGTNSASMLGASLAEILISKLQKISLSDIKMVKERILFRLDYKKIVSVRKGVLFMAGMILLVLFSLIILLLILVKLTS